MKTTNDNFDAKHSRPDKTPVYIIEFSDGKRFTNSVTEPVLPVLVAYGKYVYSLYRSSDMAETWVKSGEDVWKVIAGNFKIRYFPHLKKMLHLAQPVVYGDGVMKLYAGDGWTWTESDTPLPVTEFPYDICSDGAQYVLAAASKIYTSGDLITWTQQTDLPAGYYMTCAYGNGVFIAAGYTGRPGEDLCAVSANAVNWSKVDLPDMYLTAEDIVYENGLFVLVGNNSAGTSYIDDTYGQILTSTDGSAWTLRKTTTAFSIFNSVCWGAGLFVAAGRYNDGSDAGVVIFTSADGITWTRRSHPLPGSTSAEARQCAYTKGSFFVPCYDRLAGVNKNRLLMSPDGVSWNLKTMPDITDGFYKILGAE